MELEESGGTGELDDPVTVPEVEEESIWERSDGGELIFHLSPSSLYLSLVYICFSLSYFSLMELLEFGEVQKGKDIYA